MHLLKADLSNLEIFMLSEISQTRKDKYQGVLFCRESDSKVY
jgi:hypothetical protein